MKNEKEEQKNMREPKMPNTVWEYCREEFIK